MSMVCARESVMPTAISPAQERQLRRRMHEGKTAMGCHAARLVAERMRAEHRGDVSAYRCPFCDHTDDCDWHVGHSASMYHFGLLARYLRFGVSA